MIATTVHIHVKEGFIDTFIEASIDNHLHSVREEGNIRFDILQHKADPSRFTFYEVYRSEEDVLKHKETGHYKRWRTVVDPIMETPRQGVAHNVLAPLEESSWKK
jgi:(4S)-4-hydroxy-5-phosphonooxypentane-2,3-dione isomerase